MPGWIGVVPLPLMLRAPRLTRPVNEGGARVASGSVRREAPVLTEPDVWVTAALAMIGRLPGVRMAAALSRASPLAVMAPAELESTSSSPAIWMMAEPAALRAPEAPWLRRTIESPVTLTVVEAALATKGGVPP